MSGAPAAPVADERADYEIDGPLNLRETLWAMRIGPTDPCLRILDDSVWRAARTPLGPATERLHIGSDNALRVEAWGPGAAWLVEHAPALCGLFDNGSQFEPGHPLVRDLARRHPGLRIGRTDAVFETALGITLEQRVATPDAWRSWRQLVRSLGELAPGPLPGLYVPPSPARVARTPTYAFHRFGLEARRAEILRRLALVAPRLEETIGMPRQDAYARLHALPGIGPWTSARVGQVAFGDPDAVAVGDLHLPHLVARVLAGERRGSDERMLELLEPFRGHRARVVRLLLQGSLTPSR